MEVDARLMWLPWQAKFCIVFVYFILGAASSQLFNINRSRLPSHKCNDHCIFTLVESIPDNLTYDRSAPMAMPTYVAHKQLLSRAKSSVHLATFYWTLLDSDIQSYDNSSKQGEDIFASLVKIIQGNIEVKIVQNNTNNDTDHLASLGAKVHTLDFTRLLHAGVMHTKMWVVDGQHMYVGSGNYDWRSYRQTKETGVLIENCPCLGSDAEKLFEVYWYLGALNSSIPKKWPDKYSTEINVTSPLLVNYNNTQGLVYFSSSPPQFCPDGRTYDITAILNVISSARKFIYISVMDYIPMFIYSYPNIFWPNIDDALREAALNRGVKVYLMAANWTHTNHNMYAFLKSLRDLHNVYNTYISVKLFLVPYYTEAQRKIPYARVNHNKYMLTDQHAYIGTSNWSGDYFKSTAGVGFILQDFSGGLSEETNIRTQLQQIFWRDWNSQYATYIK